MRRNRFVKPTVVRIDLSDGEWIEVKEELNVGDAKQLDAAGLKPPTRVDDRIINPIDWAVYELERAMIFLTGWSFTDEAGEHVKLSFDALRSIDIETFDEINKAITKYVMEFALVKKARRTAQPEKTPMNAAEPISEPTSAS